MDPRQISQPELLPGAPTTTSPRLVAEGIAEAASEPQRGSASTAAQLAKSSGCKSIKPGKVRSGLEGVAEDLSNAARLLEKWPIIGEVPPPQPGELSAEDQVKEYKRQLKDLMKSTNKKLRKTGEHIVQCSELERLNIPVSLIAEVDGYLSLTQWYGRLYQQALNENAAARGELLAMASFKATLQAMLDDPALFLNEPLPPPELLPGEEAVYRTEIYNDLLNVYPP